METKEIQRLKFRRQYIISPADIQCPFNHIKIPINAGYFLLAHADLPVTRYRNKGVDIILLGDIFDYEFPDYTNDKIVKDIYDIDFASLLIKCKKYTGRYVIIYQNQGEIKLFHDATANRKIYYCRINEKTWISSHPYLLAKILGLKESSDPSKIAFYNSLDFRRLNNSNIGNTTRYDEIFQLLPNHYFDYSNTSPHRYWPNKRIIFRNVDEVALEISKIIKGYMISINKRYKIMLPVTAGKDSRLLLASAKNISGDIFYYINKEETLSENSSDIRIPNILLSSLGLPFHITEPPTVIDEDFKRLFFENNPTASARYLAIIYNYYIHHSDKVNLPGNIASAGFEVFRQQKSILSGNEAAKLFKLEHYAYAQKYFDSWAEENRDLCIWANVNMTNLIYWEERLPNWGSQTQMEKDIAQEEFNPFNSRLLVSLFLSVQSKYIEPPSFILHMKIIRLLWPKVLDLPINPSFKNHMKKALSQLKLLNKIVKLIIH